MLASLLVISGFLTFTSSSESDNSFTKWALKEKCSKRATVQCILRARNELDKWLEEHNQYTILVVGKMGSGKTTLIKGFTEDYMPGGDGNGSILPHTDAVAHYLYEYEGVQVSLYDTPGLSEEEDGYLDYKYLEDMVDHQISPNLIVFTIKLDSVGGNSLPAEDERVMKRVSDAFGSARWKFAMFVLTFANKVRKEEEEPGSYENRHYFNKVWNELEYQIRTSLKSFHVQQDVVDSIPIFPIGFLQQPDIKADKREISWVDEFWSKSFKILQKSKTEEKLRKEKVKKAECCACPVRAGQGKEDESTSGKIKQSKKEKQKEEAVYNDESKTTDGRDEL